MALAREWLAAADGRPSFCWVHLYEPHYPYAPAEPFASRFHDSPYHGDVAAADAALGPLLEPILAAGAEARTLVVLTSDHGEALGEHGEATHGIFAYEATLRVPLIFHQPRLFAPRVVATPARHVDILPTVLDALGLPTPPDLAGRSLLAAAAGAGGDHSPATYFEALSGQLNRGWAPLYGVIHEGMKYIDLPIPELYSLVEDPGETTNLAPRQPRRVAELERLLSELRAAERPLERAEESDETRRRLRALGYLASSAEGEPRRAYTEADDPKRLLALDAGLREVAGLHAAGDLAGALARCRELVRARPGMRMALVTLAQLERESGNLDAAVDAMREALALRPTDPATLAGLAAYLTQAGRAEEAVALTEPHASGTAPDVEVLLTRGLALARAGRPREALAAVERAGAIDPGNPMVAVHLGTLHLMAGRRAAARAAFGEALALNPRVVAAHAALAIMAGEEGQIGEAVSLWRRAVGEDPRQHRQLLAAGYRAGSSGREAEARALLELFVESAPADAYGEEIARVRDLLAARREAGAAG